MSVVAPRDERDWEQFTALEGQAFATAREETEKYIGSVRAHAIARFALEDDRVVAGALAFPCHQLVGGSPVSAGAVASVCVAPERRGRNLGRQVMDALVHALREQGIALAPLWPSSVPFYRGLGWDIAGHVAEYSVPAEMLRSRPAQGEAVRDPDQAEIHELRLSVSTGWTGPIVRPTWWWQWRYPQPAPEQAYRYGWREGDRLTGFVAFRHAPPRERRWGFDTWVTEFWAATPGAIEGLLDLLSADGPLSPTIRFEYGALPDLPAVAWRIPDVLAATGSNCWMLRVIDPAAAMSQSGWPMRATASVELAITEPGGERRLLTLEVADGSARVTGGADRPVEIGSGTLASWFSGALRATDAARFGLADGPPDALARMDMLTAQRRPWLPDLF